MLIQGTNTQINDAISSGEVLLVYFSGQRCTVCHVLRDKVNHLLNTEFPAVQAIEVDAEFQTETAGQHLVFTVPTLILFAHGREQCRFGRNLSIHQLRTQLDRLSIISAGMCMKDSE